MYEEYYGFTQPPFSLSPDPKFLYRSQSHDVALQQVWLAIRRKEGFIVLTGDIGTGKTTLCRTILEQFDPTTFTALVLDPFLSVEELLREVLLQFGIISKDTLRSGRAATASKHELIRTLHDFLLSLVPIHGSAVLIIDEAQHLSAEVLEEIRILSNLETNDKKLLQIVLVGQLNLLDALNDAKLRQLDQRVSIRCLLEPLNRQEVEAYITHRLWVARGTTTVTFTPEALDLVHSFSAGVPRLINLICDRALMVGAERQTDKIPDEFVASAAAALGLQVPQRRKGRPALWLQWRAAAVLAVVVASVLAVSAYLWVGNPFELIVEADEPAVQPPTLQAMGVAAPAPAPSAESQPNLARPPVSEGVFAVLVGTFQNPRAALQAERQLREHALRFYAVDVPYADGIRRRLLVGRYRTWDEAEKARVELRSRFAGSRIVTAADDRVP